MTAPAAALPRTAFALPPDSAAVRPPEWAGLARDEVRLLVAKGSGWAGPTVEHRTFRDIPDLLSAGDLLVVNTSATVPAALDGVRDDGAVVPVHVSAPLGDGTWAVEVRRADNDGPAGATRSGERVALPGGVTLTLGEGYPEAAQTRLRRATPSPAVDLAPYLAEHGRPIAYGYLHGRYPLSAYQTVYGTDPGSAEMASAGRPFTTELLVRLLARGVAVAPITLHCQVSSQEAHEPPLPERFSVPPATARLVNAVRAGGGRVVAVGTTVVRALESAAARGPAGGPLGPAAGWTNLVIGPDHPVRVVSGLVSGLHAPEASHLLLLEAVAGPDLVGAAYTAAVEQRYRWHEFGDSTLFLP